MTVRDKNSDVSDSPRTVRSRVVLKTVKPAPVDAWYLGVLGEPLQARRADIDYVCGSCGRIIASIPHTAKLSNYAIVQYEAFNEYCPKEVPRLPDYLQPYTSDPDYTEFFKPRYNIRQLRVPSGRLDQTKVCIVICYSCGANNIGS